MNAYSTDLRDESLDGQRVVIGGVVTGTRTVITKSKQTMAVATLEDLTGSLEVIVFPRLYEQTAGTWQEGAILIVAGRDRPQGRGDAAAGRHGGGVGGRAGAGPGRGCAGDRGGGSRARTAGNGAATGNGHQNGFGNGTASPALGPPVAAPAPAAVLSPLRVSPLRAGASSAAAPVLAPPVLAPPEPVPTYREPDAAAVAAPDLDDEPPLPDEARDRATEAGTAPTPPTSAGPESELHVHFRPAAGVERTIAAMEAFKTLIRERPGSTPVVVHLTPQMLPMRLRGVAYDAELLAEVRRRLGEGLVELQLS